MSNPDKAIVLYTAETDTTDGRNGASRSSDGVRAPPGPIIGWGM
jgi:hypothetical protein